MFQALLQADDRFKKEYEKIPVLSDEPMHILLNSMLAGEPYTIQKMNEAQKASFIQKLSYKFPQELLNDKQSMAYHLSAPLT